MEALSTFFHISQEIVLHKVCMRGGGRNEVIKLSLFSACKNQISPVTQRTRSISPTISPRDSLCSHRKPVLLLVEQSAWEQRWENLSLYGQVRCGDRACSNNAVMEVTLWKLDQQVLLFEAQGAVDCVSSKTVVAWPHFLKKSGLKIQCWRHASLCWGIWELFSQSLKTSGKKYKNCQTLFCVEISAIHWVPCFGWRMFCFSRIKENQWKPKAPCSFAEVILKMWYHGWHRLFCRISFQISPGCSLCYFSLNSFFFFLFNNWIQVFQKFRLPF